MADIMYPIPFPQLMDWILTEHRTQGSIFGTRQLYRFAERQAIPLFGGKLEAPYGPAAGPHTQLAQNIIAALVCGARFFELKTVQIMDGEELRACVSKPCICALDECYNCEWSTELTVPQAFEEYVKAWFACKLLSKELQLGEPDGFLFNTSVGYDLDGIRSPKIDSFIEHMKDASATAVWAECMEWTLQNLDRFCNVDEDFVRSISPHISNSITESTLHGCPPQEIERIAAYLMTEKGLHTYIKCNPTLLGYDFARSRLDALGFDYIDFDRHHFENDLQYADAVPMFRRLMALSRETGVEFGIKLTNTFPVKSDGLLPSEEMYMSGRSLYPLTIALARRIGDDFHGELPISFSGGVDIHNIAGLLGAGIRPITMATTLLKPGGYEQFAQIAGSFTGKIPDNIDISALAQLDMEAAEAPYWRKAIKPLPDRKIGNVLPLTDCFISPCRSGCPIEQDIPAYLKAVRDRNFESALQIILQRNPLPFITGTICPHRCTDKCMGNHRLNPVQIRAAKLQAAEGGFHTVLPTLKPDKKHSVKRVAIIGGGPAGLAAAAFLSRAGMDVTVFEQSGSLGGTVRHVIPEFRIESTKIDRDIALCSAFGAKFRLNTKVSDIAGLLKDGFTDIIVAIGAGKQGVSPLSYGDAINAVDFLKQAKAVPDTLELGKNIVIIGGGNTAMDAARAAKRLKKDAVVRLVYRRTRRYMSADEEELRLALEDGVEFLELLAPIGAQGGQLLCRVMELGAPDKSGRRSCVSTEGVKEIPADTIIYATGEQVDTGIFAGCGIAYTSKGLPVTREGCQTTAPHIFAIGDARRGPATVVEAIADAAAAAAAISSCSFDQFADANVCLPGGDCRGCAAQCGVCAEVCPNRANVAISVPGETQKQILHVDGMCNECGNCAVFCPYVGRPYRDKFTLYWSRWDFDHSDNAGFLPLGGNRVLVRLGENCREMDMEASDPELPEILRSLIRTVFEKYPYLIKFEEST